MLPLGHSKTTFAGKSCFMFFYQTGKKKNIYICVLIWAIFKAVADRFGKANKQRCMPDSTHKEPIFLLDVYFSNCDKKALSAQQPMAQQRQQI